MAPENNAALDVLLILEQFLSSCRAKSKTYNNSRESERRARGCYNKQNCLSYVGLRGSRGTYYQNVSSIQRKLGIRMTFLIKDL